MIHRILNRIRYDRYLSSKLVLLLDAMVSGFATLLSILLNLAITGTHALSPRNMALWLLGSLVWSALFFLLLGVHRTVIRHATLRGFWGLCVAVVGKGVLLWLQLSFMETQVRSELLLLSIILFDMLLTFSALVIMRICMIVVYDHLIKNTKRRRSCRRVLVYGTGDKSVSLVTRLQNSPHYWVAGFVTYGSTKSEHKIADLPVYYFDSEQSIAYLRDRLDLDALLFAVYNDARDEQERLIRHCGETGLKVLIAPPIDEVVDGKLMKSSIREIKIEDLLGRPEIEISMEEIVANFRGKTILVTGAAGSIGSELCRQIATFGVEHLDRKSVV